VSAQRLEADAKAWWLLRGEEVQLGREIDRLWDLADADPDNDDLIRSIDDKVLAYDLVTVTMQRMLDRDPRLRDRIDSQTRPWRAPV